MTGTAAFILCCPQELKLDYLDQTLLLPVVVEHTIDERSPLYGLTQAGLEVSAGGPGRLSGL